MFIINILIICMFITHVRGVFQINFISQMENLVYDARIIFSAKDEPDNRIVIVDIDERSLSEQGRWPWSRNKIARLLDNLFNQYKVEIVGFDIVFAEPDESSGLKVLEQLAENEFNDIPRFNDRINDLRDVLDYDQVLLRSIRDRPVVLGYYFNTALKDHVSTNPGVLPRPVFSKEALGDKLIYAPTAVGYGANLELLQSAAKGAGHFNPTVDRDGIIRRVPMFYKYRDNFFEALSLSVVRNFLDVPLKPVFAEQDLVINGQAYSELEWLQLANLRIPVDESTQVLVPYRGRQKSFNYISATDVLTGKAEHSVLDASIVLVGTSAPGLFDLRTTPLESKYPGVEIHANLIAGMLDENIKQMPAYVRGAEFLIILFVGLLLTFCLPLLTPVYALLVVVFLLSTLVISNYQIWLHANLVLPLASSLLMILLLFLLNMTYGFFVERRSRSNLSGLFGQYVPKELVSEMNKAPESYSLEPEEREMTVLFSDVRGFTTLSEGLDPKQLGNLMNEFLTPLTQVIHAHKGTIDKYMGDAIMAFWGAPIIDENHAKNALEAGLAMIEKMYALSEEFIAKGYPELRIGVGLNTGIMNVGNMGSEFRMAYTILGDSVNLGSRLEGLTKSYGVDLIVGETTVGAAEDYVFRKLDQVRVKGKQEPVSIYEPLGKIDEMSYEELHELRLYNTALDEYLSQKWQQSKMRLLNLQRMYKERFIYEMYLERINYFRENPPGENWDGVFTHTTK